MGDFWASITRRWSKQKSDVHGGQRLRHNLTLSFAGILSAGFEVPFSATAEIYADSILALSKVFFYIVVPHLDIRENSKHKSATCLSILTPTTSFQREHRTAGLLVFKCVLLFCTYTMTNDADVL